MSYMFDTTFWHDILMYSYLYCSSSAISIREMCYSHLLSLVLTSMIVATYLMIYSTYNIHSTASNDTLKIHDLLQSCLE
jgi:hypothetical protein